MKIRKFLTIAMVLLFFINIQIPFTKINLGFAEETLAQGRDDGLKKGSEKSGKGLTGKGKGRDNAKGVPEPSTLLLLGAGIAGVVAYRKIKNRNKKEL